MKTIVRGNICIIRFGTFFSLKNVYKAVKKDIPTFDPPGHGTLIGWATQGVLLLNTCLTVRHGDPNSRKGIGWETFTDAVISHLNENREGLVFMLWGNKAQEKYSIIDKEKHLVLTSSHPSPLSAYKGFLDCKDFSMCNEFLISTGKSPIVWNYIPPQSDFS
ncbi:uracil-DNA glycosylase-like [Saccostrea cucullata]|uniref:uracil-DNA glycosylase-like n=1 Tax=Saccostrea cuccullata TaxID=36930 RepID=UPI002ED50DDE